MDWMHRLATSLLLRHTAIDIEKVLKDSRTDPQSNDAEVDDVAHDAVLQRRLKNTKKGYQNGLSWWAAFCTRRQFTDKELRSFCS
jgi:hypothetical protein